MMAAVCPYCRTNIGTEDRVTVCEGCGTAHHADCYVENGGCTIFGCSKAPGDEPKVSVSTPELVAVVAPTAVVENRMPPPPPGVVLPPATTPDLRQVANRVVPSMFGGFSAYADAAPVQEAAVQPPKNRTSYIILGALLGAFGAHNFYAGYRKKAGIQLAITVLTLGLGSPMSWMWAVIDICTIDRDGRGVQFES
ncbi:MAG TPA: RING finger protein [Candidatus Sulfotelmatobacter sp.]|jgi:TM2 domain-containing membrane protein YozV|nr:RING finger protein [Candidatus Sulfotelmatobacter sp.]